jgi:tetratricopeptide (TPR) repeat protein
MDDLLHRLQSQLGDRYDIVRELGRGGMATVLLARDRKHERDVAIKVLREEVGESLAGERFLREIGTTARLLHPHVLPIFDSGAAGRNLYYVMPYVPGDSLRDMIAARGRLDIRDALRIAIQVTDGIGYLHAQGVVHRDIKPGNILVADDGTAWIADLGIARALHHAANPSVTASGVAVGTPLYMSPEQADPDAEVDGRADIYALGCVLHEMLTGRPPFTGSVHVLIQRKAQGLPGRLTDPIPDVPAAAAPVLRKCLAPDTANRFADAEALSAALTALSASTGAGPFQPGVPALTGRRTRHGIVLAITIVALLALAQAVRRGTRERAGTPQSSPDYFRFALLPFERPEGAVARDEEGLLRSALGRWEDVRIVDDIRLAEAIAREPRGRIDARAADRIARRTGAGRFITGEVAAVRSRSLLRLVVRSTGEAAAGRVPLSVFVDELVRNDAALEHLVEAVLFADLADLDPPDSLSLPGTRNAAARRAYLNGLRALDHWDMAIADSAFRSATAKDPAYAPAHFWIAQIALWRGAGLEEVGSEADLALAVPDRLRVPERERAAAMQAMGRGRFPEACDRFRALTVHDPFDFAAWFGLAECHHRDDAVVRGSGPSGWRFRSSHHTATEAYRRAFQLLPSARTAFRSEGYRRIREVLHTHGGSFRRGFSAPPDRREFWADMSWLGDSLAFTPYPVEDVIQGRPGTVSPTALTAIDQQQAVFHEIARTWYDALPESPDALEALAVSLELRGAGEAIDTLVKARRLATVSADRFRLAAGEVWLRLKFGAPDRLADLGRARVLADALLGADTALPGMADVVASLAAIAGRVDDAARAMRRNAREEPSIPLQLIADSEALLMYAAFGEPADSIRAIEDRIERGVRQAIAPVSVPRVRYRLLARAAVLAMPADTFQIIRSGHTQGDYLLEAASDVLRGDTLSLRERLDRIGTLRRTVRPADISPDAILSEALLLAAAGDAERAAEWLDRSLEAVRWTPPWMFARPVDTASFIRAMALRASLARQSGDTATADRWMAAVSTLRNPTPF